MKAGIFLATGYEEGESLFVVDVLRRGGIDAYIVSTMDDLMVAGSHNILAKADMLLSDDVKDFDMIILPGGLPGATNLRDNKKVIEMVQYFAAHDKYVAAICAAPIVLHEAGILNGKNMTSYPGEHYVNLFTEANYLDEVVVVDGKIITSRGPATTLAFAYKLVELLGGDADKLKNGMLYNMVNEDIYKHGGKY